jgi:hypothetical protein
LAELGIFNQRYGTGILAQGGPVSVMAGGKNTEGQNWRIMRCKIRGGVNTDGATLADHAL